jgi:hypothetical protein
MFVYNGLNTLCGVFILYQLRKARGCCMHVFSSNILWFIVSKALEKSRNTPHLYKLSSIAFLRLSTISVIAWEVE